MKKMKKIQGMVLTGVLAIICFLGVLAAANFSIPSVGNMIFRYMVSFLNTQAVMLVAAMLLLLVGEILRVFDWPYNLPAPFFEGFAVVLIVSFFVQMTTVFDLISGEQISPSFMWISRTYPLIFVIALIIGYYSIIARHISRHSKAQAGSDETDEDDIGKGKTDEEPSADKTLRGKGPTASGDAAKPPDPLPGRPAEEKPSNR